ncbi:DUF4147 domain-containing protein [Roseicyclus sp. F158]|uniref:DUF4147 domain-containing protein n=1 Tax=Tropicimonas omnivorans TaxID=3075590 RepID=A0ABU3DKH9_9RHOB|nr:DUF4147 domain-containing protein [Roseicyclus sp. F158]MDT0684210.1 DUF4147 domain-containing protein [Roseicyclus sp. F158]
MTDPADRAALRDRAMALYDSAIDAARPDLAVSAALGASPVELPAGGACHVIAVGKAAGPMMRAALDKLPAGAPGERLIVTNYENDTEIAGVRVFLAGHPVPDEAGLAAALDVERIAKGAGRDDVVLCLISGGGSALLPAPVEGIGLPEKAEVNRLLLGCGADIRQTNLVRQCLSRLKGGGLAALAAPASTRSLILSDVIGDDLRVVASGPTVAPIGTPAEAIETLKALGIWASVPSSVKDVLRSGTRPAPASANEVQLIGSNRMSLLAMREAADGKADIVSEELIGPVEDAATFIVDAHLASPAAPVLIFGGETTVRLRGRGLGGRNQELALRVALEAKRRGVAGPWAFLSGGTDGRDGPTDAAGACVDDETLDRLLAAGLEAETFLGRSDSYHALEASGDLIPQRPTGTNVADVQVFIAGLRPA